MKFVTFTAALAACLVDQTSAKTATEINTAINFPYTATAVQNAQATVALSVTEQGSISLSGGTDLLDYTPPADFTALKPSFDFNDAWAGVAFDDVVFHVNISVDHHPTSPSYQFVQILGNPQSLSGGPSELNLSANFQLEFHGWLNTTTPATLGYSFDVVIPNNSVIFYPLGKENSIANIGFNETKVVPGSLTSSTGSLNAQFEYSLRPVLNFSATYNKNNANCNPSPAGAATANIYNNLTLVAPSVGFDIELDDNNVMTVLTTGTAVSAALPTTCLQYNSQNSVLGKVTQVASPTPTKSNAGRRAGVSIMGLLVAGAVVVMLI
ncbi:hypothetical protein G7Y89_g8707 [Cudoniella acicularis]|uniref:Uncharacterized protein n=1 Tax=Cudoniella acicularis TaxID=354080 RepID=A0A8H4W0T7_9HELO|nr:hypothetical protein G7Y89_g8707 [Cudoniella acicularis]